MLRAYALADLFEANLDATATGIFLTTTGGNLIGLSPHVPPPLTKRLSVLGALTWRFHANSRAPSHVASIRTAASSASSHGGLTMASSRGTNGGAADTEVVDPNDGSTPLPVLKVVRGTADEGMREMAVECDGRICAYEYVREGLLVGAVSAALERDMDDSEEREGTARTNGNGETLESTGTGTERLVQEDAAMREGRDSDVEMDRERTRHRDRLVRLLSLKASAMADYLRNELKDFKMPTGLE